MSNLSDYKLEVLAEYTKNEVPFIFADELLKLMRFMQSLYNLLDGGKMYNGSTEDMSYVNILNGGDPAEIKQLEVYLGLKKYIDRNRGHVEYNDKIVDMVMKSDSIGEVDKLMEQVNGNGEE